MKSNGGCSTSEKLMDRPPNYSTFPHCFVNVKCALCTPSNMDECDQHREESFAQESFAQEKGWLQQNVQELCQIWDPFRCAIGSLLYLQAGTRSDLTLSVNILSRRQSDFSEVDVKDLKRILRYLSLTKDLSFIFEGNPITPARIALKKVDILLR